MSKKTVKYTVNLRQEHIDGGCQKKADNCPGALAINEVVNPLGLWSHVGFSTIDFADGPGEDADYVAQIPTPPMLGMFIPAFDEKGPDSVSPFSFEIELPADLRVHKLTLTGKEADTLSAILAKVGGHPEKSPRKYQESLRDKLRAAGVPDYGKTEEYDLSTGSIMFSQYGSAKTTSPWL